MSELSKYFTNAFSHSYKSKTPDEYVFQRGDYRFSVLSSRIIRVEKDEKRILPMKRLRPLSAAISTDPNSAFLRTIIKS